MNLILIIAIRDSWWPDCSKVGNTTVMKPEDSEFFVSRVAPILNNSIVWKKCTYFRKDGQFNPDRTLVNDTITVNKMADAVYYNSIAWALDGNSKYEQNTVKFIKTWFLDAATFMQPNLNYGQMHRGPGDGQKGTQTGLLCVTVVSVLLKETN